MKTLRKLLMMVGVLGVLGALALPTFAQTTGTVTVTEAQINATYRVSNPPRRSVSNVVVDLQPGRVVISATVTYRGRDPYNTVTTLIPSVTNQRVTWTVESVTINGQPASAELVTQINAVIASSWRNYIRLQVPGRVTAITVTASDMTFTLSR